MKRKKLLKLLGVALFILALSVLLIAGTGTPKEEEKEVIKIGAIVPMTGGLAHYGPHTKAAIELKLDEIGWEVAGKPIKLIIEDDASFDEVKALEKARKLMEVDKVDVLMGPIASSSFLGTETYIDVVGIPTLAIGYRGELIEWEKPGWDFASNGGLAQITYNAGVWAYEQGYRTAVTMGPDYETGYQGCGGFTDGFTKAGGTVIQHQWSPVGHTDYGPYLAALKEADITVMFQYGAGVTSFVKQYYEYGFWDKQPLMLLINDSLLGPSLAELGEFTIGLKAATNYTWTVDNPVNKKFVPAFEAKTGMKPEPPAHWAYTATCFFIAIMEKTKGDTTPEAMRDALFGLSVDATSGPVTFSGELGYSAVNGFITEVQKVDGEFAYKVIKMYPATTNPGYYSKP